MKANSRSPYLPAQPLSVTHVITGLHIGGAEVMLHKLLATLDRQVIKSEVVALLPGGEYADRIRSLSIPVHDLAMRRGFPSPGAIWRLGHLLRAASPAVVQTWMYHADLLGTLATRGMSNTKVAWNIRHSNLGELNSPLTHWTARICARLSHWVPAAIVCNSTVAKQIHVDLGYAADKFVVIPNGFDTNLFSPNEVARTLLRSELGLAPSSLLVGLVGRFHEQKDHATFVQAAALLHRAHPAVHFLLCGPGVDGQNKLLMRWITEAGLADVMHLLGPRTDMPQIMAALDLLVSSSSGGEAFPNVVGEAMACAVPCIVTDVGDSALIVGDTGFVVPTRQPAALATALERTIDLDPAQRTRLGSQARQRIIDNFSIQPITARYTELYLSLDNP